MYMSFFASGYNCKMALLQYLKRNNKPKIPLPSKLISLSEYHLQQENDHIWETVGDEVAYIAVYIVQAEFARNGTVSMSVQLRKCWYRQIFYRSASTPYLLLGPLGQDLHIKINSETT